MKKLLSLFAALASLTLVAGCQTFQALPSVQDKDNSPRSVGIIMKNDVGPAVSDLADLCEGGILAPDTKALIVEYGPIVRRAVGTYAASARACVVIDGSLQNDPAVAERCKRGTVKQASTALPDVLRDVGRAIGVETPTGQKLYLAGFAAARLVGTNTGGVIDGFEKVPDVTLEAYDAAWERVQADADRLASCAAAG